MSENDKIELGEEEEEEIDNVEFVSSSRRIQDDEEEVSFSPLFFLSMSVHLRIVYSIQIHTNQGMNISLTSYAPTHQQQKTATQKGARGSHVLFSCCSGGGARCQRRCCRGETWGGALVRGSREKGRGRGGQARTSEGGAGSDESAPQLTRVSTPQACQLPKHKQNSKPNQNPKPNPKL
jgi:hypothetical protein